LTNQREYVERVASTYRATVLGRIIQRSGFLTHDLNMDRPSPHNWTAEPTSVGDVVQLGLWLARNGYTECLDDAERLVRCRLLPCQITESPGLKPAVADDADEHRDLDRRVVGAYGGMHQPHWGKNPVTDITCAVLHTLTDVYRHVAVRTPAGLAVYFHLDYEDDRIRIHSQRGEGAEVTIQMKSSQNALIRLPGWTPRDSVRLLVNGTPVNPMWLGRFVYVSHELLPGTIVLRYGLPVQKLTEQ